MNTIKINEFKIFFQDTATPTMSGIIDLCQYVFLDLYLKILKGFSEFVFLSINLLLTFIIFCIFFVFSFFVIFCVSLVILNIITKIFELYGEIYFFKKVV